MVAPDMSIRPRPAAETPAFLLLQVGAHASAAFAERLAPLRLRPCEVGVLRAVSRGEGLSQHDLAAALRAHPSRLVALVDRLEKRGLLERRANRADRRAHALFLTPAGHAMLTGIARAARDHNRALVACLTQAERRGLVRLLRRIAAAQGLAPGVHPGYAAAAPPSLLSKRAAKPAAAGTPARRSRVG